MDMTQLDRQIDIEIIKVLSDFISKNQNAITEATGRDIRKSTDRVKVHRALNRTKKFFERSVPDINERGRWWVLRKNLDNIKQIVLEYPELLPHLLLNDTILSMLVDKHVNHVCTDEWLSDAQQREFKNRLRISATFFQLYLFESPPDLLKTIETLFSITERGQEFERLNKDKKIQVYGFAPHKPSFNDMLDVAFRTCVGADILYHRDCTKSIELIKKMKAPAIAGSQDRLCCET